MDFAQKLFYYCLLCGTAYLACYYLYIGLFHWSIGNNPFYMKQWFGLASIVVLFTLKKAYHVGEICEKYVEAIFIIMASWLCWLLITVCFLVLAKIQGKI